MEGIITLILLFCYIGITSHGWDLKKELSKTDYWESLPKGVAMFGYSLPVLIFIILNIEKIGFMRIILSILLVVVFFHSVSEQNNNFKKKPLVGFPSIMPDDVRKKVIRFYVLTPFLTIMVLIYAGVILDLILNIFAGSRRNKK